MKVKFRFHKHREAREREKFMSKWCNKGTKAEHTLNCLGISSHEFRDPVQCTNVKIVIKNERIAKSGVLNSIKDPGDLNAKVTGIKGQSTKSSITNLTSLTILPE